ncbi:MAG: tripartite tricarboxylate transporter substrate binding protein [Acetobacteraceae bacterium]|nr:tripartite tricarboxylate transporter substrate binding protein [Acetobacteraceae bacterium]
MSRRQLLAAALLAAPALLAPPARAQTVTQNVRLIVPFAPGGTVDLLARLLAEAMTPRLGGRAVVVENRSGAGTFIAMQAIAQAPADGHTLLIASNTVLATAPIIPGPPMPVDPDRALRAVANLISVPIVLVGNPAAPYRNLAELIAFGRANPGRLNIGHAGIGGLTHLLAERLAREAGIGMVQVQYRGGTPALMDVMTGTADLYFSLLGESLAHIREGKLRALATAAPAPLAALPNVPLMRATLPGFVSDVRYGIVVATGTAPEWVAFWNRALGEAMQGAILRERMAQLHWDDVFGTPEAYRDDVLALRRTWQPVIEAAGIRTGG